MQYDLRIYDVSPFIYTGMSVPKYGESRQLEFPIGGIQYLMKYVAADLSAYKDVVLVFDSRSFRKDLMKSYKAKRKPNYAVYAQLDLAYEYLKDSGITCYKKAGYEADDIIYNIVEQQRNNYLDIIIYGVDYDLTHNVCAGNEGVGKVQFCSISSQVNSIYASNFETSIKRGERIRFNTISAYKVFLGDSSDGIPPFKSIKGIAGRDIYKMYIDILDNQPNIMSTRTMASRSTINWYIDYLSRVLLEEDVRELKRRVDIVYPAVIDDIFTEVTTTKSFNKSKLTEFVNLTYCYEARKTLGLDNIALPDSLKNVLREKAKSLLNGSFAVDNNFAVNPIAQNSTMLNLKEF